MNTVEPGYDFKVEVFPHVRLISGAWIDSQEDKEVLDDFFEIFADEMAKL